MAVAVRVALITTPGLGMHGAQKLIVVVEDDASLNQAVCRLLHAAGHSTWSFDNAESALAADLRRADCLLLDMRLPGISGLELFDRLSERGSTVPAIFVSAYDDAQYREQVATKSHSTFLAKPYAGPELLNSLDLLARD
jgi:FixJ family two-component response regulator